MKKLLYYLPFSIWALFSLLPLRLLYLFSDIIYFPLYYLVRYRKKIVRKNLLESFPEKEFTEILKIEKEFYHYFCDYVMETIKLFTMSEQQIRKRMTFSGTEKVDEILKDRDCILYLGHYGNWEWISSIPLHLADADNIVAGQIYHRLENETADSLFLNMRSRFGAVNIEMFTALRQLVRYKQAKKRFIVGFISDQSPNWDYVHMWTSFLNHKSSFFTGAESIAKLTNATVVYLDVRRVKRGYYHAEFIPMTDEPKNYDNYQITENYAQLLETTIRREPQYWLWSHNRWKRSYEKYLKNKEQA